jgi:hypothetical protein
MTAAEEFEAGTPLADDEFRKLIEGGSRARLRGCPETSS